LKEDGTAVVTSELWFKKKDFDKEVMADKKLVKAGKPGEAKVVS
jgi:hypothetical protein